MNDKERIEELERELKAARFIDGMSDSDFNKLAWLLTLAVFAIGYAAGYLIK